MKHNNSKQWKVQPLIPWWRPCRWQSGRSGWSPAGPNTTPTPPLSPWPVSGTRHLSTNSRHTETRSQNRQSTWSPNAAQPLPGTVHPRVSLRVPAAEEGGLLEVGHGCSAPSSWGGFFSCWDSQLSVESRESQDLTSFCHTLDLSVWVPNPPNVISQSEALSLFT